jgi:hypothetical protein
LGNKQNTTSAGNEPVEVFRQFAWRLAGTLAAGEPKPADGARPGRNRPGKAKAGSKR